MYRRQSQPRVRKIFRLWNKTKKCEENIKNLRKARTLRAGVTVVAVAAPADLPV